ncbi:hypothetical protein PFISCL1PPCAC_2774, partial [Pristionchus fissidentatus]
FREYRTSDLATRAPMGIFWPVVSPLERGTMRARNVDDSVESAAMIIEEEGDDENNTARYSRRCGVCYTGNPRKRAAFKNCGHIVCLRCAANSQRWSCPFCRCAGVL